MGFWADYLRRHCDDIQTIIGKDGTPYMRRYHLIKNEWLRVYVHEILRSDEDPELHDHPWDFTTILLSGGYSEEVPVKEFGNWQAGETKKILWPRWSIIRHKADDLHRLDIEKPVWTLFIAGKSRRDWGFLTKSGWKYHRDFLREKFNNFVRFMGD